MNSPRMTSPPSSPSHLHVRKLSTTNEEEAKTTTTTTSKRPGRKLIALSGEEGIMSGPSGPPPTQQGGKSRFRNGHASFRLRMLQEQHGSGFEPYWKVLVPFSSADVILRHNADKALLFL